MQLRGTTIIILCVLVTNSSIGEWGMQGFDEYWTLVICMAIAGLSYVHMAISVMLEIA